MNCQGNKITFIIRFILLLVCLLAVLTVNANAAGDTYLSTAEIGSVVGLSGTIFWTGQKIKHSGKSQKAKWVRPIGPDRKIAKWLGGEVSLKSQNFLDNSAGGAITPIVGTFLLLATDLEYSTNNKTKETLQSQFLYLSGSIVNKGLNDLVKGLVRRERPFVNMLKQSGDINNNGGNPDDNHSFYSGHSSSAFFTMTFLNLRFRKAMRSQLTPDEFNNWHWLSPAMTLGWASFVGYSRIEANRHYFTDVLTGVIVGVLLGELFYNIGENNNNTGNSYDSSLPLIITIRF